MLVVRRTLENLGFHVDWYGDTLTAVATNGRVRAIIRVNSNLAVVNGEQVRLDMPPRLVDGCLYAPEHLLSQIILLETELAFLAPNGMGNFVRE